MRHSPLGTRDAKPLGIEALPPSAVRVLIACDALTRRGRSPLTVRQITKALDLTGLHHAHTELRRLVAAGFLKQCTSPGVRAVGFVIAHRFEVIPASDL